jgi:hypothetical protein
MSNLGTGGQILSQLGGFQISKRGTNGGKREQKKARGVNKARGKVPCT